MEVGAYKPMIAVSPFSILNGVELEANQDFHAPPHEGFSAKARFESCLCWTVCGEVSFDNASHALYATDASNYRQVPIGHVGSLTINDVVATVAACREFGAPVHSRREGTSPARQCCDIAVVIYPSKHLDFVLFAIPST
jgi:FAD/FMN-containing dehydrogenase